MKKVLEAIGGFFNRLDLFFYTLGHMHGERRGRPLFNLHIKRVYDGIEDITGSWPLGFEPAVEAYHEAICAAKFLIGEEVWVDEEGCIWPGYIRRVPIRIATLNVADQRGELACFSKAFLDGEPLENQSVAPHIHIESDPGNNDPLPEMSYRIFFNGRRPYLFEVYREALISRFGLMPAQRFLPAKMAKA